MKKILTSLLFLIAFNGFAQEIDEAITANQKDTIVYKMSTEIAEERVFSNHLNETYSGPDFEYTEEEVAKNASLPNLGFLSSFIFFMSKVFPLLLGVFLVFVILKVALNIDVRFWKTKNSNKKLSEKLVYTDDEIHEVNLSFLLQKCIQDKEFRLAIRYYYLTVLKGLSNKKLIDYHKDKTNAEYAFEIENEEMRNQFSYLSYIYAYVWYGEFIVDENSFKVAENKYQSFLKSIV